MQTGGEDLRGLRPGLRMSKPQGMTWNLAGERCRTSLSRKVSGTFWAKHSYLGWGQGTEGTGSEKTWMETEAESALL